MMDDTSQAGGARSWLLRLLREMLLAAGLVAAGIVLWWLAARTGRLPGDLLPGPGAVWDSFGENRARLMEEASVTLGTTLTGFAAAVVAGVTGGALLGLLNPLRWLLEPALRLLQAVPKVMLLPLLLLWFDINPEPRALLAALVAGLPVLLATTEGFRQARAEAGTRRVWTVAAYALAGMQAGLALAYAAALVAEYVSLVEGLGFMLALASSNLNSALMLATTGLVAVIGIGLALIPGGLRLLLPVRVPQGPAGFGV